MQSARIQVDLFPGEQKANTTVFVLGATGSGKTVLMANLARQKPRVLILDVKDEYPASFFGSGAIVIKSDAELIAELNRGTSVIIYRLNLDYDNPDSQLNPILIKAIQFQRANQQLPPLTVLMDELNQVCSTSSCPRGLQEIIQRGRGHKIEKIFGAQWFNTLPTWCRDSFSEIYVYAHTDEAGLKKLQNYGFDEFAVRNLPPYTCLYRKGGVIQKIELIGRKTK